MNPHLDDRSVAILAQFESYRCSSPQCSSHSGTIHIFRMPAKKQSVRKSHPAEVKDSDGSMIKKEWDSAERSIKNAKAFKSWGTEDIGIKKKAFRRQTKELAADAAARLKIEDYFDPDEIRKMYQGLHSEIAKQGSTATKKKWSQLTDGDAVTGKKPDNSNGQKREILTLSLTNPINWDTMVTEMWESVEQLKSKKKEAA